MVGGYYRDAVMPTQTSPLVDFSIPKTQTQNVEIPKAEIPASQETSSSGFKFETPQVPPFSENPSPDILPPFTNLFPSSESFSETNPMIKRKRNELSKEIVLQPNKKRNKSEDAELNQMALERLKAKLTSDEFSAIKMSKYNIPKKNTKFAKLFYQIKNGLKNNLD
jgi:hypothetical protein